MSRRNKGNKQDKAEQVMKELEGMCTSGDANKAYEALQMYRSRANRHIHKGELDGVLNVCSKGAIVLASNGYDSAALELCMRLIEFLEAEKTPLESTLRNTLYQIDDAFSEGSKSRSSFLKCLIRWDRVCGARVMGDPMLHSRLAYNLWENTETQLQATHHFAQGEAPDRLISKLADIADEQYRDQLMTMGVLHFLAVENLRDANDLFAHCKKLSTHTSNLMTFCDFLLQTCRRDAAPLYQKLCMSYSNDLIFDDSIPNLIKGPIAGIYFGLQPQGANPLFQSLLGGLHG